MEGYVLSGEVAQLKLWSLLLKPTQQKTGTDIVYSNISSGEADIGRCPGLTVQLAYIIWQVSDEKNKVDDMWRVIAEIVFWPPH